MIFAGQKKEKIMKNKLLAFLAICMLCAGCREHKEPFVVFSCPVKLERNQACIWDDDYTYFIADTTNNEEIKAIYKAIDEYYKRKRDTINYGK